MADFQLWLFTRNQRWWVRVTCRRKLKVFKCDVALLWGLQKLSRRVYIAAREHNCTKLNAVHFSWMHFSVSGVNAPSGVTLSWKWAARLFLAVITCWAYIVDRTRWHSLTHGGNACYMEVRRKSISCGRTTSLVTLIDLRLTSK